MTTTKPLFKIRSDRFEVLQGESYVSLDRSRVNAVHFRSGVLTVCYAKKGEVSLDCAKVDADDLKRLIHMLHEQRDRNCEIERRRKGDSSASILPSIF